MRRATVATAAASPRAAALGALASVLAAAAVLASCSGKPDVVIGFAGSVSGKDYQLGVEGRNAALLYVGKVNESGGLGGRKLRLDVRDFKSEESLVGPVDQALYDAGAVAIFGHFTSSTAEKALSFADERKIALVSPTATSESLSGKDDCFFRTIMSSKRDPAILVRRMKAAGIGSIAILSSAQNKAYTETYASHARAAIGVRAELSFESPLTIDFRKLSAMRPEDGILVLGSAIDTGTLAQELRRRGFRQKIYASGWAANADLLEYGGAAAEGIELVHQIDMEARSIKAFAATYRKAYNAEPTFAAVESYDAMTLIGQVVAAGGVDRASFLAKLRQVKSVDALSGRIAIDGYGDATRPLHVLRASGGRLVLVETAE